MKKGHILIAHKIYKVSPYVYYIYEKNKQAKLQKKFHASVAWNIEYLTFAALYE